MMLKTFRSRRLQFVSLLLDENGETHPKCHCHMIHHPSKISIFNFNEWLERNINIRPNMFYGLVTDYSNLPGSNIYLVVHRPECILTQSVDKHVIEFQTKALFDMLNGSVNNEDAKDKCEKLIQTMGGAVLSSDIATVLDKRLIDRIYNLMSSRHTERLGASYNETMAHIHTRIPDMLKRLNLTTFHMDGRDYTIDDVPGVCVVYFGITRAICMSEHIYGVHPGSSDIHEETFSDTAKLIKTKAAKKQEARGLVFTGYNSKVGHELIRDIVEIPALNETGYTSPQKIEDAQHGRILSRTSEFNSVFTTSIFLDLVLSVAIMLLSGIGPMLSMYTARLATAPYQESYLKMGTCMRWAVEDVSMFISGTQSDDWMISVIPAKNITRSVIVFFLMALGSSTTPFVLWASPLPIWNQFRYDNEGQNNMIPGTLFGYVISILGCVVGVVWVLLSFLNSKHKPWKSTSTTLHIIVNIILTTIPVSAVYAGATVHWVYLYLLEAVYFTQWLYGELFSIWQYESTGLFMAGVLGAIRLNTIN